MLSQAVWSQEGDRMTFTFKLEQADGTPAEPPTIRSAVTNWRPGDTIPLGPNRTLQVVRIRDDDADQPPVLVVQDLA
jgi:hypothetical protein